MQWLCSNGQVYHHSCKRWTASVDRGRCENCGEAIPTITVQLARDQVAENMRLARHREVQRKTAATARKLAEMQARTDATLQRSQFKDRETDG